jgi:hypothetical protein
LRDDLRHPEVEKASWSFKTLRVICKPSFQLTLNEAIDLPDTCIHGEQNPKMPFFPAYSDNSTTAPGACSVMQLGAGPAMGQLGLRQQRIYGMCSPREV